MGELAMAMNAGTVALVAALVTFGRVKAYAQRRKASNELQGHVERLAGDGQKVLPGTFTGSP